MQGGYLGHNYPDLDVKLTQIAPLLRQTNRYLRSVKADGLVEADRSIHLLFCKQLTLERDITRCSTALCNIRQFEDIDLIQITAVDCIFIASK